MYQGLLGVEVVEDGSGEKGRNSSLQCWCAASLLPLLNPLLEGAAGRAGMGSSMPRHAWSLLGLAVTSVTSARPCQDPVVSLRDAAVSVVPAVLPAWSSRAGGIL